MTATTWILAADGNQARLLKGVNLLKDGQQSPEQEVFRWEPKKAQDIMADKPDMRAAVVFYLIYLAGVVFFAVAPALRDGGLMRAVIWGALLGALAYATYDLTNQATLRDWPLSITLADIPWGAFVTAIGASAGFFVASRFD